MIQVDGKYRYCMALNVERPDAHYVVAVYCRLSQPMQSSFAHQKPEQHFSSTEFDSSLTLVILPVIGVHPCIQRAAI
jgi:hypothetical protein